MHTILLVEDDGVTRYAVSRHLTHVGFHVIALRTTTEALREVDSGRHIDAFVLDVSMPEGNPDGVSVALMLRRRLPATPILFVTGHPQLLSGYKLPGKVLLKPVGLDKLTDEIRALFSAPPET